MEEDKSIRIGKKIRETMNSHKMSVKELAQNTGIELQTLYSILNGHHQASVEKLAAISKELHLSIDALLDLEVNTFPIYSTTHEAASSYAKFEDIWFGITGGERISVSRNLSVVNQSMQLRKEFLENIYKLNPKQVKEALSAFEKRKEILKKKEKRRLEIVVESELIDYITRREPFNQLSQNLVEQSIENVIQKLENDALNFEVIIIPRQNFLVNYEIINREVILFDLGSVFFRQTHDSIVNHFLAEVEMLKFKLAKITDRNEVIQFFKDQINVARKKK
jgi:transcriptional regulator with XRE-family HTH domain